jgi:hypothetical protein
MKGEHIALLVVAAAGAAWWLSKKSNAVAMSMPGALPPGTAVPPAMAAGGAQPPTQAPVGGGPVITPVPEYVDTSGPSMEDIATAAPVYDRGH